MPCGCYHERRADRCDGDGDGIGYDPSKDEADKGNGGGEKCEQHTRADFVDSAFVVQGAREAHGEGEGVGEPEAEKGESESAGTLVAKTRKGGHPIGIDTELKRGGLEGPAAILCFGKDGEEAFWAG